MKKYIEIENKNRNATHLKIETYYSVGGINYFTHKTEQRGYYLSVTPVERSAREGCRLEGFAAFSGIKICVLPVSRRSKKAEENAEKLAADHEKELIDYVCNKNGLVLMEG